jgi:hypothetical protein
MDEAMLAWLNERAKKRIKGKAGRQPGEHVKMGTWRTAYMKTVPEDDPAWTEKLENEDLEALLASLPARVAPVTGAVENYDGEIRPELYNDKYDELEGYHEEPYEEVDEYITTDHDKLMREKNPLEDDSDDEEAPIDDIDWGSSDDEGGSEPDENGGAHNDDGKEFPRGQKTGDTVPAFTAGAIANWGCHRQYTKFRGCLRGYS